MTKVTAWTVCAVFVVIMVAYCGYRTGYVRAYCATKYAAEATWTGWAGQNGECLMAPSTPAETKKVP